jgi:predicted permease
MSTLRRLLLRVVNLFRGSADEPDLARELASHLQLLEDEFLRRGLTPQAAKQAARRTLGGVEQTKEIHRDARSIRWLLEIRRDVQYAWRTLRRSPGFTAIAVLSIAFGTGANVAIFSAADALILRPMPVMRPSELLTVGTEVKLAIARRLLNSYPDYLDMRDRTQAFSGLVAYQSKALAFNINAAAPPTVRVTTLVSGNFFSVLGVTPEFGRAFTEDEVKTGGNNAVTVLSYGMWQSQFAADPHVLGRTIRIAGVEFTIVGVTPERFRGVEQRYIKDAAYVPLAVWPKLLGSTAKDPLADRGLRGITVLGRLAPGRTAAEAEAELATIAAALQQQYPDTNARQVISAKNELELAFASNPLDIGLLAVASLLSMSVLAVACANVAGLLASRAPVRAREIALRLAIGAGRARLVRQLITESILISLAGAAAGIVVGQAGIKLMDQIQYPTDVFARPEMALDQRTLVFSLAIAIASAILFGLGPALQTTRVDLVRALKTAEIGADRRSRITGRSVLVTVQVALSLVAVTISVFAFQVFGRELDTGPGFRTTQMAKISLDTSQARFSDADMLRYYERAVDAARELAGTEKATIASGMPLFAFHLRPFDPDGFALPEGQTNVRAWGYSVDEGYFDTLEIPIVEGRGIARTDTADQPLVAVVNETLAAHYWPGQSAVGKRFHMNDLQGQMVEVVGVARTSKYGYFAETPQDALYYSFRQDVPSDQVVVVAATRADSLGHVAPLRDAIGALDDDVPVFDAQTIEMFYEARVTRLGTVITRLIAGLGAMGVILTMIGLYGLVSFAVSRRTKEMGIRIAIGANYGRLLRMVLRQGLTPAWFGLVIGLVLAIVTTQLLPALVFPIEERANPWMYAVVSLALTAIAIGAAFVPARRAAKVNPVEALRSE